MGRCMAENVIQHNWGYELTWASTEDYTGKILVFGVVGSSISMHFHKEKTKTWFVNSGKFIVKYINTDDGSTNHKELSEGETWHCNKLQPCQLQSLTNNASITEVSSKNILDDIFYLAPLQVQTKI